MRVDWCNVGSRSLRSYEASTVDKKPSQKSVALLIETSNAYARALLGGIASYMHETELWSIQLPEPDGGAPSAGWLAQFDGDGIIARIENQQLADTITELGIPTVDVSGSINVPNVPRVESNEAGIAELAYEHLRACGFKRFAFCGDARFAWSNWRQRAFAERVEREGFECSVFPPLSALGSDLSEPSGSQELGTSSRAQLRSWISDLPKPIGMLACSDAKAQELLDICGKSNIYVPRDVALLGVDDDDLLCALCIPSLSSIIPAAHQTGRKAAELLDQMMSGTVQHTETYLVDPIGISSRQSTDVLAINDSDIAAAVQYIRDHCCDGINVKDFLKVFPMSRRSFESRFQALLGCSPHQEILRQRIDRVRHLLLETDLTLAQIAKRTGFQNQEYMSVAFRRSMDMPPGMFRKNSGSSHKKRGQVSTQR